ncbi:MAG: hypothetical protein AB7T49_06915 [Oligoflexales bacterium]
MIFTLKLAKTSEQAGANLANGVNLESSDVRSCRHECEIVEGHNSYFRIGYGVRITAGGEDPQHAHEALL